MTSSASDVPLTKSESFPASDEALPAAQQPATPAPTPAVPAPAAAPAAPATQASSSSQLVSEPAAGGGGHEGDLELINDVSVSKEEMERYMKITRDLKLRRGSLMPPGGTSGTKVTTTPIALCSGLKKKPNLTMETRVELYGKGRVKLSFDGVSEEAHSPQQQPPLHQDDSVTSLVRRGGPSTGITPRRLSLEERAPPPTPAPSLASVHKRNKSMDFGTIPLKDDDHPEPSNPV
ncbi:hypothetical protein HPB51_010872 [Rhipicephalus microplus]|uniref:Uncharacterized protein n=1 Tax=Rhipicephalus microplus TaxID=6941 RepID=A0A9J6DMH9_RHIMP|nr:hypothetical protein HPB51_010872 [Rhipicephalus microplus]